MDKEQLKTVQGVAYEYHICPEDLWKIYNWIMEANFEQDLDEIAEENLQELKEMSGE